MVTGEEITNGNSIDTIVNDKSVYTPTGMLSIVFFRGLFFTNYRLKNLLFELQLVNIFDTCQHFDTFAPEI